MGQPTALRARTAKEVIDDAIRENSSATWLLYGFAIVFVLAGVVELAVGSIRQNPISQGLGVVAAALFYPAITATRRTRKENIAIRLLEVPLSQAATEQAAAKMLHLLVRDVLSDKKADGK